MSKATIRPECLCPATHGWEQPTGDEVREVLRLAGFTAGEAESVLGLKKVGGRTVRRWISGESNIPFAAWALLCEFAGFGEIWKNPSAKKKALTPEEKFSR